MSDSPSHRSTSPKLVARRLKPAHRLSAANTSMPAKKHHVAGEGFFRSTLAIASSTHRVAAAKGSAEKSVMVSYVEVEACLSLRHRLASRTRPPLPSRSHHNSEQRHQRQREEERPALAVNDAVDHVRPDVDAEHADDEHPEPVAEDAERNHEGHEHEPPPRARQEHVRRQDAGDEQHPARADSAALLGDLSTMPGNSKMVPWRTSGVPAMAKYIAAASAEASAEPVSIQSTASVRQRNHEDQEREREGRGGHPPGAEEQEPARREKTHDRRGSSGRDGRSGSGPRASRAPRPAPPGRRRRAAAVSAQRAAAGSGQRRLAVCRAGSR